MKQKSMIHVFLGLNLVTELLISRNFSFIHEIAAVREKDVCR